MILSHPFAAILVLATLSLVTGCSTPPRVAAPLGGTPEQKALAARADDAIRSAADNPGREFANRLRTATYPEWLRFFKCEGPQPVCAWPTLPAAMTDIARLCSQAESGADWPRPPLARVPRVAAPPVIDGKLDDPAWTSAIAWSGVHRFNEKPLLANPKTTWKIAWDDQYLYFAFDCEDSDIIAPLRKRDDPVYNDDCVEMFILPDFRFRTYWEVVIAPGGSIFDSVECKNIDTWGLSLDPAQNLDGMKVGIQIRGTLNQPGDTDQGYTVEVAIPFRELPGYTRTGPKTGDRLHFMLVRLDRQGKDFNCYAYQPLLAWGHNLWNHGQMELVEK